MSAAFTPGPWRLDGLNTGDGWGAREDESSIEIACIPHDGFDALEIFAKRNDHDNYDEFVANAHLIAAAPELYEAARLFVEEYDAGDQKDGVALMLAYNRALEASKAALARARGEGGGNV
jgi:hypothetical protein